MSARVTTTHTLISTPGDLTVADLSDFIEGLDSDAKVTVRATGPDRPGELGQVTLTVTPLRPSGGA